MLQNIDYINIAPMNDWQEEVDLRSRLQGFISRHSNLKFTHTLCTFGHKRNDPFVIAQFMMSQSTTFHPLIAVNPAYINPVQTAKKIITLSELYPNQIALNLITGSFQNEARSIGDLLSFEEKQNRLIEFWSVLDQALSENGRIDFQGKYYQYSKVELFP
ncbi:MAG: LLM class flavin-dependent oxidoreductase, partial [Bdellovibrionales bacterium]|nr:LLM class flavin-dependent oxidoreductase [Bdellovibrionales bacterium]